MPVLPTRSFATIVNTTISGIQGRANRLLNFSIGSTIRSICEGFAGIYMWYQAMTLQLLTAIRLSTSAGTDVDTFTADFMPILPGSQTTELPGGSPRLGAQAASGLVTFTRFTAGPSSCFVQVGATIQSSDRSQTYEVTADATFSTFSATPAPGGYTMAATVGSLIVPVEAVVPGAAGNAQINTITVINSSITGIDAVTNQAALTNGADQESDLALKKRFSDFILGLSRGDLYGLTSAIEGIGVTVQFTVTEGYNYDGSPGLGFFLVADDGSGTPSPDFLNRVLAAATAVRPLGMPCFVFPPVIIFATVVMQLTTAAGYDHNTVVAEVAATIANNINALGLGNELPFSILSAWAYSVAGVTNVTGISLNGLSGDTATILTTKPTLDGLNTINYATIKCRTTIIS